MTRDARRSAKVRRIGTYPDAGSIYGGLRSGSTPRHERSHVDSSGVVASEASAILRAHARRSEKCARIPCKAAGGSTAKWAGGTTRRARPELFFATGRARVSRRGIEPHARPVSPFQNERVEHKTVSRMFLELLLQVTRKRGDRVAFRPSSLASGRSHRRGRTKIIIQLTCLYWLIRLSPTSAPVEVSSATAMAVRSGRA